MASTLTQSMFRVHSCSRSVLQTCTEASTALEVSFSSAQLSHQLQNLTHLLVKSCSILNAPFQVQVLLQASVNALAES
jgi:hypothetical protein